ncbi:MAG: methyltransferase domain-containing protein [Chthoniobacterales bacterium]
MEDEPPSTHPDFWSKRYATAKTPWKIGHLPERLHAFIRSLQRDSKILIPGCGDDPRAVAAFDRAGHRVTAIDFSPVAVERAKESLPRLTDRIILADFFNYDFGAAVFDAVYERTFLCSLPPRLWNDYAARVAELLRPGAVLAGFFFYGVESDPPPFPLTESKALEIFGGHFYLRKSEPVTDSLPIFGGKETWQEWQLGSGPG